MLRALAIWIIILNTSTITLSNAMLVVEDEAIELGDIGIGESRRVEIGESLRVEVERADSVRVVFRLGDEWIGTDLVELRDTIRIEDNTETFEVEVETFE